MRQLRSGPLLLTSLLLLVAVSLAQETPATEGEAERRTKLAARGRLVEKAGRLQQGGKPAEAIKILESLIVLERELFGDVHEECAGTLAWIAALEETRGYFDAARNRLEEVQSILAKLHGEGHWKVADAHRALRDLAQRQALTAEETAELAEAAVLDAETDRLFRGGEVGRAMRLAERALTIRGRILGRGHADLAWTRRRLARLHEVMGEYAKAEPLYRQALEIYRQELGADHPDTGGCLTDLADLYLSIGDSAAAEPLCREAVEVLQTALGTEHPRYARSVHCLAGIYGSLGEHAKAEPLYRQALEICRRSYGDRHANYATALGSLAVHYQTLGEFARADALLRQALEIRKEAQGEGHPQCAVSLSNLAMLYQAMGEYARAEPLYRQGLEILRGTLGEEHPNYAGCLDNLAMLHFLRGEYAEAEPLCRQALEIRRRVLGEGHPHYALSLQGLSSLYYVRGEYAKAEPLCRQAVEITKRTLGEEHPYYAASLDNLALVYRCMGEHAMAEPLHLQALEILGRALGEEHPEYARTLVYLSHLHESVGEPAKALPLLRRALSIQKNLLDATFAVQSERQQLQMSRLFRESLDSLVSLSTPARDEMEETYAVALLWKGAVFARQLRTRLSIEGPRGTRLLAELESANRRLATLSLSTPGDRQREAWRRQIRELSDEKEELERELSLESEAFREERAVERLSPAELRMALPEGVVLVDLLEYERQARSEAEGRVGAPSKRHLAAFLVAAGRDLRRVDLGLSAPIREAVAAWRAAVPVRGTHDPARKLHELLWKPLAEHLEGAEAVLFSPDGALSRLPLSALPGREVGRYLIEEVPVAVVPVPQMLPRLLARFPTGEEEASLLLVGDVNYEGSPGTITDTAASRPAAVTGTAATRGFAALAATRSEVTAIRDLFRANFEASTVRMLLRERATEAAFRAGAPKHRWLHLATHGFFAPEQLRSALAGSGQAGPWGRGHEVTGYHPGLLSGLALAGANTPPEPDGDDGVLTALEVASLDLSDVELAVLSACETGLGEVAGGEGVLGVQRAFQVAGARTTVTSLWCVPDRATRLLMERLYSNLWDKRMPKLEALREAQIWLMRQGGDPESEVCRGLGIKRETLKASNGRLPPYYWAGWVLSGDWR
jgi:CHAT domain-containing protein/Tfp pilus assembly protein PilF